MTGMIRVFCLLLFLGFLSQNLRAQGNLVIVGGGLESDNKQIFEEIIRLAGGADAKIAVIPAASGVAAQTFAYFSKGLTRFGIHPGNIFLIPIALEDDDSTTEVNEAEWKNNAWDHQWAAKVRACDAVWFSGGDQLRIIQLLLSPEGKPSPVMSAVWEVYRRGGLIGGTSAGAAIMSDPMIANGTSMGALEHGLSMSGIGQDLPDAQGVILTKGLGFFTHGMVDQHFHARARTGRMTVVLGQTHQRFGFGIDENTALVYYGRENRMMVAGAAGVTIFDTEDAAFSHADSMTNMSNLKLHFLTQGDQFFFDTYQVVPAEGKQPYVDRMPVSQSISIPGGIFSTSETAFYPLLTRHLFGRQPVAVVKNLQFLSEQTAISTTLMRTSETKAFYLEDENGNDHFTITGLRLDIEFVSVSLKPLN